MNSGKTTVPTVLHEGATVPHGTNGINGATGADVALVQLEPW